MHPGFARAFQWLQSTDLASLPLGKHSLDGDRLFVIVARDEGRGQAGARLEAHRRYIDIQYIVSGDEAMGWRPTEECRSVTEPYASERDIAFFGDAPESWFAVPAGSFTIFYPSDAHAPLAGLGLLQKAVVKVAVDW